MYRRGPLYQSHISIHAPAGGATGWKAVKTAEILFQFTPLREGRRNLRTGRRAVLISIHAPAGGATMPVLLITKGQR